MKSAVTGVPLEDPMLTVYQPRAVGCIPASRMRWKGFAVVAIIELARGRSA
jgi:hypothetical protein